MIPELVYGQPQTIRNNFHRVQRRVRLSPFKAAQISLIEAAAFPKFHLAQARLDTQLSNAPAKALSEGFLHWAAAGSVDTDLSFLRRMSPAPPAAVDYPAVLLHQDGEAMLCHRFCGAGSYEMASRDRA